ncbi:MAG: hypothetical protein CEO12_696 [Parcubacteria group bacterium Gr01-1014_46]|nr:MAG: hypothetical protein CEO12_696 [Parcubacteria group bacterium Gr01-1014_46]
MMGGQINTMMEEVYEVPVIRSRSPHEALDATGLRKLTTDEVVAKMPRGKGDKVKIHLFCPGKFLTHETADVEYAKRGLVPADPYSLAAKNEEDPHLIDTRPNTTHWQDENGNWCSATFYVEKPKGDAKEGERFVCVVRNDVGWEDTMWYAGVAIEEEEQKNP